MKIKEIIIETMKTVKKISEQKGCNRYIKKHPLEKMFMILLYQQYSGLEYGRALTVYLRQMLNATCDTLSQSELSKKLAYRLPKEAFNEVYKYLLSRVRGQKIKKLRKLKQMVRIIDSTALPASLSMNYARHRCNKNGFKMHTVIDENYFPDSIKLKNGRSSDRKSLKWAIKEGYIHIFDRGYNDYSQFRWILEQNASFVTRAFNNIQYTIIKNRKVGHNQKAYGIIGDKHIEVIEDRRKNERLCLRLVTFGFIDSTNEYREFALLTNLLNHRSEEIAQLYRERWNIEVVFRWLKTVLKFNHWLSRSKNGVLIQIYTALCAYLMVLIAKMNNQKAYRIMKDSIYEFMREFKVAMNFFDRSLNFEELFLESS